jgi:intracellular multiplication protein IcmE
MNLKLQNITHLFKNVRTRTMIMITGFILVFGFLVGVRHLMNKAPAADSSVQLKDTPSIQSVPGGLNQTPSAEYQRLQQQENIQQAALAEKTGASAIPTLLDTSQFSQSQQNPTSASTCCGSCACVCGNGQTSCSQPVFTQSGTALLQPSHLRIGTLIYDTQGHVIGRLGSDGKVRNGNGEIIGQVGPDGLVRALDGSVIGSAALPATGDSIYDATGHLIGHVDADGKVRNASGVVIGAVGADGIVRDSQGKIIGKTGVNKVGALVYDAQGHLLGAVGTDGKVRDAKGNVLGEVDANGIVRDAAGKIIGKTGVSGVGASVYDTQGHLIGRIGTDGKVYDAQNNSLGEVDANGLVRDEKGKILGRAYLHGNAKYTAIIPGTPVYDNQGKLIGTVAADGQVRDSQDKVIGTISHDGLLRNADQAVIGSIGATTPGTPIYDHQGHLVGTVGSDGIVRDSQGKSIARIGSDNIARDTQGTPLGSTVSPQTTASNAMNVSSPVSSTPQASVSLVPSATDNPNPELQAILDRQAQQISAQKAEQLQQQFQSSMTTQANQLFVAWASPTQQYVVGLPEGLMGSTGNNTIAAISDTLTAAPAVKAGTIMYAVLLTAVNSDEPGPVLAEIVQGKFKGARLIGTLSNQGQKVLLSFNTLVLPKLSRSIPVNTVAIDESTARTALSSYTNNHYWLRYGTLFASAFVGGYGQSFLSAGSPYAGAIIINPGNKYPQPDLKPRDRVFFGLGQVGVQYAAALGNVFSTPPTVHVYSGTPMGILFLTDLAALPE